MEKLQEKNITRTKKKEEKGITLIALVITIIVLLILAGVSIAMLTGENGILTKARLAKQKTDESGAIEKVQLAVISCINENGLDISAVEEELNKVQGIETNVENLSRDSFPLQITVDNIKIDVFLSGDVE